VPEKIIRDPVHDVISFRLERSIDAVLFQLINAAEFQRLRRIRQLGMASLAYPGADHSRYSHSLGVMEIARRMLTQLALSTPIEEIEQIACAAGALLHDLGHGPLSHVFEEVGNFDHEAQTRRIILNPQAEIHQILAGCDARLPELVANLLSGEEGRPFLSEILSSQLDADRFDYLLRDNLMTGSRYGGFDLRWLLHALAVDEKCGRLTVSIKGLSAVEAYLQSRHYMYRNVYFHKVVRTGDGMVKLALRRASELAKQDRLEWLGKEDWAFRALAGEEMDMNVFNALDDVGLFGCLKQWSACSDPILSRLCFGVLFRKLYKVVDITAIEDSAKLQSAIQAAKDAVKSAGGDPEYLLFYDEPHDTPYEIYDGQNPATDIAIQYPDGRVKSFAEVSPLMPALSKQLMFRRLHVAEEYRSVVERKLSAVS
jgi:HD superfamily phosphohydrolase